MSEQEKLKAENERLREGLRESIEYGRNIIKQTRFPYGSGRYDYWESLLSQQQTEEEKGFPCFVEHPMKCTLYKIKY